MTNKKQMDILLKHMGAELADIYVIIKNIARLTTKTDTLLLLFFI